MSLDYPNRKDWLAVRYTPRMLTGRTVWNRGTFNEGRNAEKRHANSTPYARTQMLANRRLRQRMHPATR